MDFRSIAFLIGILILSSFRHLPHLVWIGILLPLFLIYVLFSNGIVKRATILLLITSCGFSWALLQANWQLQNPLAKNIEDKTIKVQGYIASVPEQQPNAMRFEFQISQAQVKSSKGKVRLTWNNPSHILLVGDKWQFDVRLKRPRGTMNPGGFDFEEWLFGHGIHATGYVINSSDNHLLQSKWYHRPIDRLRQKLATAIQQNLSGTDYIGFITALTVGMQSAISPQQWQVLRNTGTNHLMAIAGLHIGLIAGMTFFLINFFWRRNEFLTLRIPAPEAAAFAALLIAFIYSALAGFSLPTQRAVIMLSVFLMTVLLRRHLPPWRAWSLALLLVLILDPAAPLSASFWLSFVTVALIIYGMSGRLHLLHRWRWIQVQWIIAVGLVPLMLIFFQQVSLVGFIANLLAIPWVGFVVLPLSLMGSLFWLLSPTMGGWLWHLAKYALQIFWPLMQKMAAMSWLQWQMAMPNVWISMATFIGILFLLAPRGMPARWLGVIWLLPLFFWQAPAPKADEVWFTLLDVGQGLSAVVHTQHHLLVYDTGPRFNDNFDLGEAVVVPYLHSLGINKVDMLVISHPDSDHSGGAASVIAETKVMQIMASVPQKFANATSCLQGQHWQWDGVDFQFLYPPSGQTNMDNDSSCVLRVTSGKNSLLLTGDIEKKSEKYLVQNETSLLATNILVAPHHGSISSSTDGFVAAAHPQYVLFPVGYLNRFKFPNPKVIARYKQIGAIDYDSVNDGAIIFKFNNDSTVNPPQCYRIMTERYWNN